MNHNKPLKFIDYQLKNPLPVDSVKNQPQEIEEWFAYKDGKVVTFNDEAEAAKFSDFYELSPASIDSQKKNSEYWNELRIERDKLAFNMWYTDVIDCLRQSAET